MTKTAIKHSAQDSLLQGMANMILAVEEGCYGTPDEAELAEMRKQAQRVMKLFNVTEFNGLGRAE